MRIVIATLSADKPAGKAPPVLRQAGEGVGQVFERDGIHAIAVQQLALVNPGKG